METVSLVLWVMASLMLVLACIPRINKTPICFLGEVFSIGGFVRALDEYNAGTIPQDVSLLLVVGMLTITVYCTMIILDGYMSNVKVKI